MVESYIKYEPKALLKKHSWPNFRYAAKFFQEGPVKYETVLLFLRLQFSTYG